jgi:hypothetical protein
MCLENGIFEKYGVDVHYSTIKEGTGGSAESMSSHQVTGAMLKKLHDGEADIAITVTDGLIAGRAAGSNVSLIGTYVESPLTWAVCAAPDSKLNSIDDFMRKGRPSRPASLPSVSPSIRRKEDWYLTLEERISHDVLLPSPSAQHTAAALLSTSHGRELQSVGRIRFPHGRLENTFPSCPSPSPHDRRASRRGRSLSLGSLHDEAVVRLRRAQIYR